MTELLKTILSHERHVHTYIDRHTHMYFKIGFMSLQESDK